LFYLIMLVFSLDIVYCVLFVICDLCIVNFHSVLSVVKFSQNQTKIAEEL
jgi:hypothetical protein